MGRFRAVISKKVRWRLKVGDRIDFVTAESLRPRELRYPHRLILTVKELPEVEILSYVLLLKEKED